MSAAAESGHAVQRFERQKWPNRRRQPSTQVKPFKIDSAFWIARRPCS